MLYSQSSIRSERNYSCSPRYDIGYQSVRFHLKQRKEEMIPTQIMCAVTINGRRFRIYIKQKVEPAFWDTGSGCCICNDFLAPRVKTRMEKLNSTLADIRHNIDVADMQAAENGRLMTIDDLRAAVLINAPEPVKQQGTPLDILHSMADNFSSAISNKGGKGAESSRKTYLNCCRRLEAFAYEKRLDLHDFSQFDRAFYRSFAQWLSDYAYESRDEKKRYCMATIQNTLRGISNLHRKAYEAGYTTVPECKSNVVHCANESNSGKIYLSEKELQKLSGLSSLCTREQQVRDMFVLAAYTGLRISDVNQLNNAVVSDGYLRIFQKKTHGYAAIPLLKEVSGIVDHYSHSPEGFPVLNQGTANKLLKQLCHKVGIDILTPVRECRGGEVITYNRPKYELVSFHTARRSCITNLFRRGYSPNYLMTMSGHKSIASFQRYVRTDAEELSSDFLNELKKQKAI